MDPLTLTFLVVGGISLVILVISLVAGEVGHLGLHPDAEGPFSLPAIAAFLGGGGFGGAIASGLMGPDSPTGLRLAVSLTAAAAVALPVAWGAVRFTSALVHMPTDGTLSETDLLGATGVVVTAVTGPGRYGEVRLVVGGHAIKLNARSAQLLPVGTPVYVIDVPSATSVEVISTADPAPPTADPALPERPL